MRYSRSFHSYSDADLISGTELSKLLGVSPMAVSKAKMSNRIDSFDDSKGRECFHRIVSAQQFRAKKDRRHVTTPTIGQKAAGMDALAAQATAHDPKFDFPRGKYGEPLPNRAPTETFDFGAELVERKDLEISRAEKEYQLSRLAKLKADAVEGKLVDKTVAFNKIYGIASAAQEKIVSNYITLAPQIVGKMTEAIVAAGFDELKIRKIAKEMEHDVGEMIRKENLNSLRNFTESLDNEEVLK